MGGRTIGTFQQRRDRKSKWKFNKDMDSAKKKRKKKNEGAASAAGRLSWRTPERAKI